MTNLKNVSLSDLGLKKEKNNKVEGFCGFAPEMRLATDGYNFFSEKDGFDKMSKSYKFREKRIIDNFFNMNNKFLEQIKIIKNIKDKPGHYLNQQSELTNDLEPEHFIPPSHLPTKIIPLTFRKFFAQEFPQNINEFALKNSEILTKLIDEKRNEIEKDALTWLDYVSDKQISEMICQVNNYSNKRKIYKSFSSFQNSDEVIQWIIDTNLKMSYESADWNKDGIKTFSEEKGNLLIIDASLFQRIEINEQWETNQEKDKRKFPLPLPRVWNKFAAVINFPLKNNFQFLIIDKRALIGWKNLQELEIKYDESNTITYFLQKMEGGFQQLTYYNACAFISE
ncbi:MAG: hypothetical protein mread185_000398 [Mycoplasmataceae bacterium]|nr:MAG: hypothetical protein mread185_000398 [Mycoplasmataceae bacterium]